MRVRRAQVLVAAAVGALVAVVVASAAGVGLVPARLTSVSAADSIAASTCSLTTSADDAYVDGAVLQMNTNFGSSQDLWVRSWLLGNRRSFVRFDLSTCAIPSSARVTSATLGLFMSQAPSSSRTYDARRVTAAWVESTVTWANQPAVAAATSTTASGTSAGVTLQWTVTSDVQAFVAGTATNNGWRVADTSESAVVSVDANFGSRERSNAGEQPTLSVSYYP